MNARRAHIHQQVHFAGLFLLAVSLPLSKFTLSCAQFIILINWFSWGNPLNKFRQFFKNRLALLVASIYFLHVLGLVHTAEDWNHALRDLRIKLPLLALPVILSTAPPVTIKQTRYLLMGFTGALFIGTGSGALAYAGLLPVEINDARGLSLYISHIRFALLIVLGMGLMLPFVAKMSNGYKLATGILYLAFTGFLALMESVTGLATLCVLMYVAGLYTITTRRSGKLKAALMLIMLLLPIALGGWVWMEWKKGFDVPPMKSIETKKPTSEGGQYYTDYNRQEVENGNYVWLNFAMDEIETAWNNRSDMRFSGEDKMGQPISATVVRYLASKGLSKDSSGVKELTADDVNAIENGATNYRFKNKGGITERVYDILWEFDHYLKGGNPGGNSVTQRFEFWKTGFQVARKNPVIGVGTGDVQAAFNRQYRESKTQLDKKYWLRAHNQYLTMFVTFGFIGFLWFLVVLVAPLIYLPKAVYFFPYLVFFTVAATSMLTEDTLETQIGVTLYAFFNSFLLFGYNKHSD